MNTARGEAPEPREGDKTMVKELERMAREFFRGMTSFALYPTYAPPPAPRRKRRAGIGQYFATVGGYMTDACRKFDETHRSLTKGGR